MWIIFAAVLTSLLFTSELFSQTIGLSFTSGFPMGEFKDNVDRPGFGVSGELLLFTPTPEAPLTIGLNLGFLNYGSEISPEHFSSTIPDVWVDVERTNNITNFHVLFKLAYPSGMIRPYAEGLFGGSYFYTDTKILTSGTEEISSTINYDDFAWSYGAGGGLLINLSSDPASEVANFFLDLKVRYLFGSRANYLKEGSISIENGNVFYDVSRSKTELMTMNIGIAAYFTAIY